MKPLLEIVKLNQTRYGLDFDGEKAIEKLHEEIIKEFVPALNSYDVDEMVDALNDTIVIAVGELTKLGVKPRELPTKLSTLFEEDITAVTTLIHKLGSFKAAVANNNTDDIIAILHDIIQIAAEGLLELKYQPVLTLKQVVKTISSRNQDPIQAKAWATGNRVPGEKWLKDKNQDPETLYTADFSTCKFK